MKVLKLGSVGPSVELLQLALGRAGARSLAPDGIFGSATKAALRAFQSNNGLAADGVAGPATHRALMPYYTGFASHRIHRGDTLFALSQLYNVPLTAILTANPGIVPEKLAVGSSVVIPLPFDIVPTNISFTSALVSYCVRGIGAVSVCENRAVRKIGHGPAAVVSFDRRGREKRFLQRRAPRKRVDNRSAAAFICRKTRARICRGRKNFRPQCERNLPKRRRLHSALR